MLDPIVVAIGVGLVASIVAGRVMIYALEFVPLGWRKPTQWLVVCGACGFAVLADVWSDGPGAQGALAFVIAALPGLLAYLVFRTAYASMVVSLLPLYFIINPGAQGRTLHMPAIALDRLLPVVPAWMVVYGSLYVFVLLPVIVVRPGGLFRRAMQAFLMAMLIAFAGFLLYPTVGPRPTRVLEEGFFAWCLRLTYSADTPYNCFPSLHVANSFISALACYRVHRRLGVAAAAWASLIGASTLFTKQHYFVDVVAGVLIAWAAYVLFLRGYPRDAIDESDRQLAPRRAAAALAMYGIMLVCFWIMYRTGLVAV